MKIILMYAACLTMTFIPLYFIANKVYRDGIFGRLSLAAICFLSGSFIIDGFFGGDPYYTWREVGQAVAFAVFLCWHLFRFHSRVVKNRQMAGEPERSLIQL